MGLSPRDWVPPDCFDEYRLVKALGRGSLGQVWLAHDIMLDRLVAVKFIAELPAHAHDAVRQRFLTEARAAARVQHPNIITVYRVGEIGPRPYLISEYVRGDSLARIARPVVWPRLLELAIGLARGLAAAHRQGVLHCDLKPANAIISETGEVKLLDFGFARLLPHAAPARADARPDRAATPPGDPTIAPQASSELFERPTDQRASGAEDSTVAGENAPGDGIALPEGPPAFSVAKQSWAPHVTSDPLPAVTPLAVARAGESRSPDPAIDTRVYMPPEAWAGEPATSRSDVYSLGALLYVLGANARPHRGDSPEVMREAVLARDTLPLAVAVPGIDARFAAIVDRCLRRDPAERFASGDDVREALEALAGDDAPVARVLAQAPHVRPALQRRWAVLGVVLALVLAFFAYPYVGGEPSRHPVHAAPPTDARPQARTPRSPDTPTLTAAARSVGAVPGGCPEGMVPVPAGTFQMGSPEGEGDADEHPQHEVTLPPYCIDRTEVTVAAYAECVAAKGCRAAPLTVNSTLYTAEEVKRYSGLCNRNDRLTYPINCVDWNRAAAYCTWQSKRLPSEAEWEYAARGKGDRVYPWGNEAPNAKRLNMWGGQCVELATHEVILVAAVPDDSGSWDTTPVGRYPDGRSPFGALDMAGNVWEWTADWYGSYATQAVTNPQGPHTGTSRVTRGGGSFELSTYRIADRNWPDPEERAFDLGFRCARGR